MRKLFGHHFISVNFYYTTWNMKIREELSHQKKDREETENGSENKNWK